MSKQKICEKYLLESSSYSSWKKLYQDYANKIDQSQKYRPLGLEIELTGQCNINCCGCVNKKTSDVLDIQRVIDFMHQGVESGLLYYTITGGEPFLYFDKIQEIVKRAPLDLLKINTNGYLFSDIKSTYGIIGKLIDSGFVSNNTHIRPAIYVSQGQQNEVVK